LADFGGGRKFGGFFDENRGKLRDFFMRRRGKLEVFGVKLHLKRRGWRGL